MKNEYEVRGEVTAIIINSPKHGRIETLISSKKLGLANEFSGTWGVVLNKRTNSIYVQGEHPTSAGKRTQTSLHRWIMGKPKGYDIDHKNHDTLNNTDDNLRVTTHAENLQNRKGAQINSKSGVRGVYWNKQNQKWHAQIQLNGKVKYLGSFDDLSEAEKVRMDATKKYMPFSKEAHVI